MSKSLNEKYPQLRLLDNKPLEFSPPPGFLPDHMPELPSGDTCIMCGNRALRKPSPVMVRVVSIDGVAQPLGTYLAMRKQTLDKVNAVINKQGDST